MNFKTRYVGWMIGAAVLAAVIAQARTTPAADDARFELKTGKQVERVGDQLFTLDPDGKKTLAKDGTYSLKDGRQFVIRKGKIASFGPLTKAAPKGGVGPKADFPSDQTTLKNTQTTEVDKHTTTVPSAGSRPGITQENPVKGKVLTTP